ncbi:amidase domain-containing protein [Aneurinibacillus sp. BA2021]|nr:amidase domain-containing protein [Aneurinibacillus sp. BA2021]
MDSWKEALETYLQCRTKGFVTRKDEAVVYAAEAVRQPHERRWQQLAERKAQPLKSRLQINGFHVEKETKDEVIVRIEAREWYAYKLKQTWHEQEKEIHIYVTLHRTEKGWLIAQEEKIQRQAASEVVPVLAQYEHETEPSSSSKEGMRYTYNRLQAVRYAEAWWNDSNPQFRSFDVDCTNFISQCLYAGGIPMHPTGNRSTGWWYQGGNSDEALWSYSWAVAHSFRWYLENGHVKTETKPSADLLSLGDVICYDFDGDGRWQHSTIVVAKDGNGMPLVNAHTTNSRHRYWDYRDSTAYTSDIEYRFFHII